MFTAWAGNGGSSPAKAGKVLLRLSCLDSQSSAHSLTPHFLPLVRLRVSSQIGIYLFGVPTPSFIV